MWLVLVAPLVFRAPSGPAAARPVLWAGLLVASRVFWARPDLRPPRGLPARSPSALRAFSSARRLVVRPGPAGLAAASNRAGLGTCARPCPPDPPAPFTPVGRGVTDRRVRRLIVLPGPGLLRVAQFWLSIRNFARNSPADCSSIELRSLELQCFRAIFKSDRGKLCVKFVGIGPGVEASSVGRPCWYPSISHAIPR